MTTTTTTTGDDRPTVTTTTDDDVPTTPPVVDHAGRLDATLSATDPAPTADDVAAALTAFYRATPDHDDRLSAARTPVVMGAVVAHNTAPSVIAAYATLTDPAPYVDPYAVQRRRATVLAAAMADALHGVDPADVADVLTTAYVGWADVDPADVARAVTGADPAPVRGTTRATGDGTRTVVRDRNPRAVRGMAFSYTRRGAVIGTATVGADDRWTATRTSDGAVATFDNPSAAGSYVNGGSRVNGWADGWRDAVDHRPDDYARA